MAIMNLIIVIIAVNLINISFCEQDIDPSNLDKIYNHYKKYYDKEENDEFLKRKRKLELLDEFANVVTEAYTLRTFTPTAAEDTILQNFYFADVKKAKQDDNDYSTLTGIFATEEGRAMYYYSLNPPAGYLVEFPNPEVYEIRIRINPCQDKVTDLC
jgi:hypothetical protein